MSGAGPSQHTENTQGQFARIGRMRAFHEGVVNGVIEDLKADAAKYGVDESVLMELKRVRAVSESTPACRLPCTGGASVDRFVCATSQRWFARLEASGTVATTQAATGIVQTVGGGQTLLAPQYAEPPSRALPDAASAELEQVQWRAPHSSGNGGRPREWTDEAGPSAARREASSAGAGPSGYQPFGAAAAQSRDAGRIMSSGLPRGADLYGPLPTADAAGGSSWVHGEPAAYMEPPLPHPKAPRRFDS